MPELKSALPDCRHKSAVLTTDFGAAGLAAGEAPGFEALAATNGAAAAATFCGPFDEVSGFTTEGAGTGVDGSGEFEYSVGPDGVTS